MSTLETPGTSVASPAGGGATVSSATVAAVQAEFARLCEAAIAEAERQRAASVVAGDRPRVENMDRLIRNIAADKADAAAGTLPPSLGRRVLGVSRAGSDWGEVPELMDRLYPIDEFYKRYM